MFNAYLTATLMLGGLLAQASRPADPLRWSDRLPAGHTLRVCAVYGDIRIVPSTDGEVSITGAVKAVDGTKPADATKPTDQANPVQLHGRPFQNGVAVFATAGVDDTSSDSCARGAAWESVEVRHSERYITFTYADGNKETIRLHGPRVDFEVRVPAGITVDARTIEGKIDAERVDANIHAGTLNGPVRLSTQGLATARALRGHIDVDLNRRQWDGSLGFSTVEGNVVVRVPASVEARVKLETLSGNVTTDFPFVVSGTMPGRSLSGTIGQGGGELVLSTGSGNIELRRQTQRASLDR